MHSIFDDDAVGSDTLLWRYFTTDRLIDSLESRMLYFASAHQFSDPFEGAVAVLSPDFPVDPRYIGLSYTDQAFKALRRLTKISCWHRAEYESDAMWKLYAGEGKGVAVQTTKQRLLAALKPFRLAPDFAEEDILCGAVRYVDLHLKRLKVGTEERFFYKHRAFEWEREFRLVISVRKAEEFSVQVPDDGIKVPFEPAGLIDSIYLGPNLQEEDRRAIAAACEACPVKPKLVSSTLLGSPRYV